MKAIGFKNSLQQLSFTFPKPHKGTKLLVWVELSLVPLSEVSNSNLVNEKKCY